MKAFLGVFFLYWLTGLSSKPILACDAHPGVPHERWAQFVSGVNAADAAKATTAAAPAATAKQEDSKNRRVERVRPRGTATESVRIR